MQHNDRLTIRKLKAKCLGMAIFFTFTFALSIATAQEGVNAAGGDALGSGGSASYSVGQVAYQVHSGSNGSVAEGVQQPYEISVVTALDEAKGVNLSFSAYPNPVVDNLTLTVDQLPHSKISFQLHDMNGKLLKSGEVTGSQASIEMSDLEPGTYFVKVYAAGGNVRNGHIQSKREVKTFKIIKTQ